MEPSHAPGGRGRRALVALVLVPFVLAAPAAADGPLASGGGPGGGWIALLVASDGEPWTFEPRSCGSVTKRAMGIHAYDADGTLRAQVTSFFAGPGHGEEVRFGAVTVGAYERHPSPFAGCSGSIGYERAPGPSTTRLVAWVAGDFASWEWEVRGGPGVVATIVGSGPEARLWTGEDFAAPLHARASLGASEARADAGGEISTDVEGTLFGHFTYGAVVGANALTADGPAGPVVCPCFFHGPRSLAEPAGLVGYTWPPGPYRFGLTGGGVTTAFTAEVFLVVADVRAAW